MNRTSGRWWRAAASRARFGRAPPYTHVGGQHSSREGSAASRRRNCGRRWANGVPSRLSMASEVRLCSTRSTGLRCGRGAAEEQWVGVEQLWRLKSTCHWQPEAPHGELSCMTTSGRSYNPPWGARCSSCRRTTQACLCLCVQGVQLTRIAGRCNLPGAGLSARGSCPAAGLSAMSCRTG